MDSGTERHTEGSCEEEGFSKAKMFKTPHLPEPVVSGRNQRETEILKTDSEESSSKTGSCSGVPLQYSEPIWSEVPDSEYSLNILKSGVDVGIKPLDENKSFYVVGRLVGCDIRLEHPSISRYHAILQFGNYGISDKKCPKSGWHLYDLGSTHGCWWNKQQVPPKQYIRLHVGHVLKFGGSSRLFVLQGPTDDKEKESSRTVTEMKRDAEKRKLITEGILEESDGSEEKIPDLSDEDTKETAETDSGITWGLAEEYDTNAKEEEEEEGEEIDFENLQQREEYYRDDPKKVLRNWFERSGFELNYQFSEKGFGFRHHWVCNVELPLDTPSGKSLSAEVTVSGSKREAQVKCALEACRILDANGVLRSQSESKKRKLKNLEENDYYDSDEDTFLDRTGELERKRAARKRRSEEGMLSQKAETYEGLRSKLAVVEKEMQEIRMELDGLVTSDSQGRRRQSGDTLDDYMLKLHDVPGTDDAQETKVHISKLKLKLVELKKEAHHWERLAKIAKPVSLPPLKKPELLKSAGAGGSGNQMQQTTTAPMVWIGSMKGHRLRRVPAPVLPPVGNSESEKKEIDESAEVVEEEEEDEQKKNFEKAVEHEETTVGYNGGLDSSSGKLYSAELPPKDTGKDTLIIKETKKVQSQPQNTKTQNNLARQRNFAQYNSSDPDYAVWLPPENQSGDGTTALNEKFGY